MRRGVFCLIGVMFFLGFYTSPLFAELLYGYWGQGGGLYTIETTVPNGTAVGIDPNAGLVSEIEWGDGIIYTSSYFTSNMLQLINPATGAVESTLTMTFPPEGSMITALEFVGNTLYGGLTTEGSGSDSYLVTINTTTGAVTTIGQISASSAIGGLAYSTSTGTMYAVSSGRQNPGNLFTVNLGTGAGTLVGPVNIGLTNIPSTALEFGPSGTLYALPRNNHAITGHLLSINPATGAATDLGDLGAPYMNALTAVSANPAIPTLSEWGMIILSILLAGIAIYYIRKQKNNTVPA